MRPRNLPVKRPDPNISVRIPGDDLPDFHTLAEDAGESLKRYMALVTLEILKVAVKEYDPNDRNLVRKIRNGDKTSQAAFRILDRNKDGRTLPMNKTVPTRIHFSANERPLLIRVSIMMGWAQGYVVWEAFRAALTLATFENELEQVPTIIRNCRGIVCFESTLKKTVLGQLTSYARGSKTSISSRNAGVEEKP